MTAFPLCQLSDVAGVLGEPVPTDQPTIDRMKNQILSASAIFFNQTSLNPVLFSTTPTTVVEKHNVLPPTNRLPLRVNPIVSVISVSLDGATYRPYVDGTGTPGFIYDDICVEMLGLVPRGCDSRISGWGRLIITYQAGYLGIPSDVSYAVASTVALWKKQGKNIGSMSDSINGASSTFDKNSTSGLMKDCITNYSPRVPWL